MNRFLIVLFLLFCQGVIYSQSKLDLYSKPYKDSIALRWQFKNASFWASNCQKGMDIYRQSPNGVIIKVNDTIIRPFKPMELSTRYFIFEKIDTNKIDRKKFVQPKSPTFINRTDTAAMNALLLMSEEMRKVVNENKPSPKDEVTFGDGPDGVRFLHHSIICFSSKEAALVSGLYFIDRKIERGVRYTYFLCLAGQKPEQALAQSTISSTDSYVMRAPFSFSDVTNQKKAYISWKKVDTSLVFIPTYNIYRSDKKEGPFLRLNKFGILAVYQGKSQRDSTRAFFSDSTLMKNTTYYYKVQGLDIFGDLTPFSDVYKVTEKTLLEVAPKIIETKKINNPYSASLRWEIKDQEMENIEMLQVFKSNKPDTLFKIISGNLKPTERIFLDTKPGQNNYYKIMMKGKAGDTLWSPASYILFPDSISPSAPVMLDAKCDSNGIVTLTWKHGNEIDLQSFKLFRSNYAHEEFSRVATINRVDTIWKDTIPLKSLTKQVFYKLVAYDESFNPSGFSNVQKALRYDVMPPNAPAITEVTSNERGIRIKWANSSSNDLAKTILYRKVKQDTLWKPHKVFLTDTADFSIFIDSLTAKGVWYDYRLQAVDENNLTSDFTNIVSMKALDNGFRSKIVETKIIVSARKKIVKLTWVYKEKGIKHFQIFKSTNDGVLMILKTVGGGERELYDKNLSSGRKYHYTIKAIFHDGGESPMSEPMEAMLE
ncbi:MAG: hypothetical protein MUF42_15505 [Cytophagaceae bacterium]|jgi:hypothetical protein|nr:hypothetical protein [Cytophagaceae bacterium]